MRLTEDPAGLPYKLSSRKSDIQAFELTKDIQAFERKE
jgi:hypothetical protein